MTFHRPLLQLSAFLWLASIVFSACKNASESVAQPTNVAYQEAKNYFTISSEMEKMPIKIISQKQLNKFFGMAAYMGKGGNVTMVDFNKYFIIPIALPESYQETEIAQVRLQGNKKQLHLHYTVKEGKTRSFSTAPLRLIMVSNEYKKAEILMSVVR